MKHWKRILISAAGLLTLLAVMGAALILYLPYADYGFSRDVPTSQQELRLQVVSTAQGWLGAREGDQRHKAIIDLYNSHEPLAVGYMVTYEDNWCSTFASAVAIECGLTDIIPTECGCERHIGLFADMECWEEADNYMPLPGDYIFYAWDEFTPGDCTGWADHVGIVVGTWGPFIKVIEGNKDDSVAYRYIIRGDLSIRGYGLPDYASKCE